MPRNAVTLFSQFLTKKNSAMAYWILDWTGLDLLFSKSRVETTQSTIRLGV